MGLGGYGEGLPLFALESALHVTGYQITDMAREERWPILTEVSIPTLGLQAVAVQIAGFVTLRKLQHGGEAKDAYAIGEWEHDLRRLRDEIYPPYRHMYPWPTTRL